MKIQLDDPLTAAGQLHDVFTEDQHLKSGMLKVWQENIHFVNGNQAIEYDRFQGRFQHQPVQRRTVKPQMYITNEIEPIVRTLVAFLTRNKPQAKSYPTTQEDLVAVRRARNAQLVFDAKWDVDQEYAQYVLCAYWMLVTGNVFRKDYWDVSQRPKVTAPDATPFALVPSTEGKDGPTPTYWGDTERAVLSGFQMAVDFNVTEFAAASWVMEYSLQAIDWVRTQFNQDLPGFTRLVDHVEPDSDFGRALEMDLELRYDTHRHGYGSKPKTDDMVVLKEFYQEPHPAMPWNRDPTAAPRGRMVVATRSVLLYDGPSPYRWHPYTFMGYEPYLGRFWRKSLVEQLIPLQRRLNEINGTILENAQTMAAPQWLVPENTTKHGVFWGKPGTIVRYVPHPSGARPERLDGVPLPLQFFNERSMILDTMVRIAGTNAIMQGNAPAGVSAASALQMLLENAQSQYGTLINQWEKFIEDSQTKKLQNFARFCRENRADLIDYLKRLTHDLIELDIESLTGDDLDDNVNVVIEAGSSIPKSEAAKQAQISELGKQGVLGDIVHDPLARAQYLQQFGLQDFDRKSNSEYEKIQWEHARMLKGMSPFPSEFDQHPLHLPEHIALVQKPSFIENASDEVKALTMTHIQWHQQQVAEAEQRQQQQMMEQAKAAQAMETEGKIAQIGAKTQGDIQKTQVQATLTQAQAQSDARLDVATAMGRNGTMPVAPSSMM